MLCILKQLIEGLFLNLKELRWINLKSILASPFSYISITLNCIIQRGIKFYFFIKFDFAELLLFFTANIHIRIFQSFINKIMTKKSILMLFLTTAIMVTTESANAKLSFVSRANCLPLLQVNESISYDLTGTSHQLYTFSTHQRLGELNKHTVKSSNTSQYVSTWRSYAGHNGDTGTSTVSGTHMLYSNGREYVYYTYATNCNLGEW